MPSRHPPRRRRTVGARGVAQLWRWLCLALLPVLAACAEPGLPDLVVRSVDLDAENRLTVTIANDGSGEVPPDVGDVIFVVDGRHLGGYNFVSLADQSIRNPGSATVVETNHRLGGGRRLVSAWIDAAAQVEEDNEFQNRRSVTLEPAELTGPDYVIEGLSVESGGGLQFEVVNRGNSASSSSHWVNFLVHSDDELVATWDEQLPALDVGESHVLSPDVSVEGGAAYRAAISTFTFAVELDSTNNSLVRVLPDDDMLLEPYHELLSTVNVLWGNIVWRQGGVVQGYPGWSQSQKAELDYAILQRERGVQELAAPPVLDDTLISVDDAWQIFLAHVAHALWLEVHDAVPWNLEDFTNSELNQLLSNESLFVYHPSEQKFFFAQSHMGAVTAWNPRVAYEFMATLGLIESTQLGTVLSLTDWMRGHLRHVEGTDDPQELYAYGDGEPPFDRVIFPFIGLDHVAHGCWGTSGLYAAVLRGVNIPVGREDVDLAGGNHSRPVFPSIDRGMPHGDDPYSNLLLPSGGVVPAAEILYPLAEIQNMLVEPEVDCSGGECNTPGEQAAYNAKTGQLQASFDSRADGLLYQYAVHGAAYVDDSLRGRRLGGQIIEFARPYFTEEERATMIQQIEAELETLGDGDLQAGEAIVIERFERFIANR